MTRRDAIRDCRALLRHLAATGAAPDWRAALRALIRTAETVERAQAKRLAATSPADRQARAARGGAAAWADLTPAERSAEMSRRRRIGQQRNAKIPPSAPKKG